MSQTNQNPEVVEYGTKFKVYSNSSMPSDNENFPPGSCAATGSEDRTATSNNPMLVASIKAALDNGCTFAEALYYGKQRGIAEGFVEPPNVSR